MKINESIMGAVVDAHLAEAERTSPEIQQWREAYQDTLDGLPPPLASRLEDLIGLGLLVYSEEMFFAGWQLRGDPDRLLRIANA